MPEGPEIRRAADRVEGVLAGRVARQVRFQLPRLWHAATDLEGRTVTRVQTWGKAMLTWFDLGNHPESLPVPLGRSIDDPHSLNNLRMAAKWAAKLVIK